MSRPATDAEAGRGLQRDPADPVPEAVRHVVERIDDHDGPPFERCAHCERAGSIRSINPFAECPARELPSRVEQRADRADADDEQEVLA
jgi:hypothetical protein